MEQLRDNMKKYCVTAAVGTAWQENITAGDIKHLVSAAENMMYADKAEYYKRTGIDRRR